MGPLADKINKRNGLIICSIGSAMSVSVLLLPFPLYIQPFIIMGSALVQFSFDALYHPLRQSLVPFLVLRKELQVTTTLVRVYAICFVLFLFAMCLGFPGVVHCRCGRSRNRRCTLQHIWSSHRFFDGYSIIFHRCSNDIVHTS